MKRLKLLVGKDAVVRDINGRYIFTAPVTERGKELIHDDGWEKDRESWLAYRNRTEGERIVEEIKKKNLADDIVTAYNSYYGLD